MRYIFFFLILLDLLAESTTVVTCFQVSFLIYIFIIMQNINNLSVFKLKKLNYANY